MGQHGAMLTPEERARVMELQDLLIERFVEHREAVAETAVLAESRVLEEGWPTGCRGSEIRDS